jgi:fibro-slime domain-containing protein
MRIGAKSDGDKGVSAVNFNTSLQENPGRGVLEAFMSFRPFSACSRHVVRCALGFLLLSASAAPARTLMFLVDWWLSQPMDTVIGLNVYQPSEVVYLPGGTPPAPKKSTAYVSPAYEQFAWWYSLDSFNVDDYSMGRIRINTLYQRGWYQMDSTYTVPADTLLDLKLLRMDTAKTLTYRNPVTQRDTTVALPTAGPDTVRLPKGAWFRAPKLYTSQGNGGTALLNQRPTTSTGGQGMGSIDKCLDSLVGDTVWIRFTPAGQQQPTEASMKCTNYNPFAALRARVYLRSPWPGSSPTVQWNGQEIQMYPWPSNPDFMYADLRYLPTQSQPPLSFRFHKSLGSAEYFDSAGVGSGTVKPFSFSTTANNGSYWFVAPEGGASMVAKSGTAPLKPFYYLYIQNPWSPGTPRVVWENDQYLRVMRPTDYCGWYKYPLYSQPVKALIGHSFEDSLYGTAGVMFRTRTNWVTLQMRTSDSSYWIQTMVGATTVRGPATATTTPATSACGTDTLKLVMEAFDFLGRGQSNTYGGGNPAFQVGGPGDNTGSASSGLVKGMVQTNLGANGLPVYTGRDSGYQAGGINGQGKGIATGGPFGKSTPSNWFDTTALRAAVPGIAIGHTCLELPLVKTPADSGYYKYNNQSFFPLDTINDKRGWSPMNDANSVSHNFLFCLHGHAAFEYTPGLKFEFRGDDDVWVFINKKLSVDLGGTHAPESSYVDIDKLHLVEGQVYPFDIFYCERQTNGSSILIRTSMDLQPSWQYKDTIVTGAAGLVQLQVRGQKSQNYRPSCADLTSGPAQWTNVMGRIVVVGPDGSDLYAVYNNDTTLYGGALSFLTGLLKVDTTSLAKSSLLPWTGQYKILLQSKLGDPLDSVVFTKKFGAVIVQGLVMDSNGDGIADSIRLVAPKAILADGPSYHLVWFKADGTKDSVVVAGTAAQVNKISDSIAVVSISAKAWGIRTSFPTGVAGDSLGAVLTSPSGVATAVVNRIKLSDGIAPVADSAYLKYDATGAGGDTMFVWTSEPLKSSAATKNVWAILGSTLDLRDSLIGTPVLLGDGSRFAFVFAPGADPYLPGDSLRLGSQAGDLLGNAPGTQSRWVPIGSNTVVRSWMLDGDGNGAPDSVGLFYRGSLASTDSVRVHWKTSSGADTVVSVKTAGGIAGTGLNLPAGILGGATFCSACTIDIWSGGSSKSYPLADSVPAAATKAWYRYGTASDTLVVVATESLTQGSAVLEGWVASKAAGATTTSGALVAALSATAKGDTVVMVLTPGLFAGDSVRLRKWSADAFGNVPGAISPWVKVDFGSQPIRVVVWDANGDGRADSVAFRLSRSASGAPTPSSFTVQWGGKTLSVSTLPRSADSLSWAGAIGPFDPATTAPLVGEQGWMVVGSDSTTWRARVVDSVAPVATKASLRFGLTMDTLIVTSTEALTQGSTTGEGWFGSKSAPSQDARGTLVAGTVLSSTSGTTTMLVSPGSFAADSVRLRGWSCDAFGNCPGGVSPWVPVVYGPQPIRVQVYDRNGDGSADSVVFRLTRSASGAPVPTRFGLTWNGQTLSATGLVRSADGLSWSGSIGPFQPATSAKAGDAGWLVVGADSTSYRAVAEDSVAPVAISGKLVFGFDPGAPDTIVVKASEGLAIASTNAVRVNSDSGETRALDIPAGQILGSTVTGDQIRIVVTSGSIPDSVDWVRLWKPVSDGHAFVGDNSNWVRLVVTPSGRAALFDADGDGRADSAYVWLRGTLPAGTAKLWWSDTTGATDSRTWTVSGSTAGFGIKAGSSSQLFQKGATACGGTCHITFSDGSGNVLVDWSLADSVAPIVKSGRYSFGTGSVDTLRLVFSEPISVEGPMTSPWILWGSTSGAQDTIHLLAGGSVSGTTATVLLDSARGARTGWDSVRFVAGSATAGRGVSDPKGNLSEPANPWAPLTYGLPAMVVRVTDPQGLGRGTDVEVRLAHPVPAQAVVQILNVEVTWSGETRTVPLSTLSKDAATGSWKGALSQPFAAGVTAPGGTSGAEATATDGTSRTAGLEDGVPPAILRARYRYSTAAVAMDTLIVEYSEPWSAEDPGNNADPFVTAGVRLHGQSVAPMAGWDPKASQLLTILLDTSWEGRLDRGDSARLAYMESGSRIWDAAGNRVGVESPWVPIEFGLRPAEFQLKQVHSVLNNKGDNSWTEPGSDVPPVELLVRVGGAASDNWKRVDDVTPLSGGGFAGGSDPKNDFSKVMAVYVKLNRKLDGKLFIYDNIGTSVATVDLGPLAKLWPDGSDDAMREVRITWNGVGPNGKFVASGVYLMRVVAKSLDSQGNPHYENLLWKYGWIRPSK